MSKLSKPRTDSKLANLPEAQQHALSTWLRSGVHPIDCVAQLKDKFGVSSSSSAVYRFYRDYVAPMVIAQRALAVETAGKVAASMSKSPGQWDAVLIQQIQQRVFELMLQPDVNSEQVFFLMQLVQKSKDQQLKESNLKLAERRVKVLESKMAEAKQKLELVKSKGGLTQQTLKEIEEAARLL